MFDPDVYQMNWAWYDGRMSEEQYRHEHGLEAKKESEKENETSGR